MATPNKVAAVEEARAWYEQSIGLIFTDYRGLSVSEMQELRKSLRAVGAEFHVVKNTLFRRAVGDDIEQFPEELHSGTTATVFVFKEQPACAKAVVTFGKAHQALQVKGGFFDGKVFSAEEIDALSKLPSRDELLSMIVGLVAAPMSQLVGVLNEVIASPIRLIDAIIEKSGGSAPEAKAEEPLAAEPLAEPSASETVDAAEPSTDEVPTADETTPAEPTPESESETSQGEN